MVSTNYKWLFLQSLLWDAQDAGSSLFDVLKAASRARLSDTKTGKVLIGTSRNGQSATFALPVAGSNLTPLYVAEMCADLLQRYAAATSSLLSDGNASPTDQQMFDEMADDLTPVREQQNDYIDLRIASRP